MAIKSTRTIGFLLFLWVGFCAPFDLGQEPLPQAQALDPVGRPAILKLLADEDVVSFSLGGGIQARYKLDEARLVSLRASGLSVDWEDMPSQDYLLCTEGGPEVVFASNLSAEIVRLSPPIVPGMVDTPEDAVSFLTKFLDGKQRPVALVRESFRAIDLPEGVCIVRRFEIERDADLAPRNLSIHKFAGKEVGHGQIVSGPSTDYKWYLPAMRKAEGQLRRLSSGVFCFYLWSTPRGIGLGVGDIEPCLTIRDRITVALNWEATRFELAMFLVPEIYDGIELALMNALEASRSSERR